jgi:hypothetical protein
MRRLGLTVTGYVGNEYSCASEEEDGRLLQTIVKTDEHINAFLLTISLDPFTHQF